MAYSNINISVRPYVAPLIPLDPTRVLILINGSADVMPFGVDFYAYETQLSVIADADDLVAAKAACVSFFGVQNGKKDAVVAVYNSDLSIFDTFTEYTRFYWVVLAGQRSDCQDFAKILTKCSGNGQFVVTNEASGVVPTGFTDQPLLIQICNTMQIALPVISYLTQALSTNQGFDCSCNIPGVIGSGYAVAGIYNQLAAAGCNFYTLTDGLLSFEPGITNSKVKIERTFFSQMFLPVYIKKELADFRSKVQIKESSVAIVNSFFINILMNLFNKGYLKKSELLNNLPFLIDNIEIYKDPVSGVKGMRVYFRYSFNNNIDVFTIDIEEVA